MMADADNKHKAAQEERFSSLSTQSTELRNELDFMQQQYQHEYNNLERKYILSLQVSMKSLFEVITYVNKVDKRLVEWHYRSDKPKGALRLMGLDRKVNASIEKGTEKLKRKVSSVNNMFDKTYSVFGDGVEATSRLKKDYDTFSMQAVEEVSSNFNETKSAFDEDCRRLICKDQDRQAGCQTASAEASRIQASLRQLEKEYKPATQVQEACSVGSDHPSCAQKVIDAKIEIHMRPCSWWLCFCAGILYSCHSSSNNAISSSGARARICRHRTVRSVSKCKNDLLIKYRSCYTNKCSLDQQLAALDTRVTTLESVREALRTDTNCLSREFQNYTVALKEGEDVRQKIAAVRAETQQTLQSLRQTQIKMEMMCSKLERIKEQLEECQYAKTRGDIAERLRNIVLSIQGVSQSNGIAAGEQKVKEAIYALTEIDERNEEVLKILELAAQQSE